MSLISYTVMRNVEAKDQHGQDVKIAIALIEHENGQKQRVSIREDLIRFAGESIIDVEVKRAAASPGRVGLLK